MDELIQTALFDADELPPRAAPKPSRPKRVPKPKPQAPAAVPYSGRVWRHDDPECIAFDAERRSLLKRLGDDAQAGSVRWAEVERHDVYVKEQWWHYQAVLQHQPPDWERHCRFRVAANGLEYLADYQPKYLQESDWGQLEFRGPKSGLTETGYRNEIVTDRRGYGDPQAWAQAYLEHALATAKKPAKKRSRNKKRETNESEERE